jgi:hypothetical protein
MELDDNATCFIREFDITWSLRRRLHRRLGVNIQQPPLTFIQNASATPSDWYFAMTLKVRSSWTQTNGTSQCVS